MIRKMHPLCWIGFVLLIVGGLNWGLVGLAKFDLVAAIFGELSILARIIYILVGLSAVGVLIEILGYCPLCKEEPPVENSSE